MIVKDIVFKWSREETLVYILVSSCESFDTHSYIYIKFYKI